MVTDSNGSEVRIRWIRKPPFVALGEKWQVGVELLPILYSANDHAAPPAEKPTRRRDDIIPAHIPPPPEPSST